MAIIGFVLQRTDIDHVTLLKNEQAVINLYHGDSTVKVRFTDGQEAIVHIEVQTGDSQKPMWARLAQYCGYLIGEYQLPVYGVVLYLRPEAGQTDPGRHHYKLGEWEYLLQYKVIRLSEVEGRSMLAAGVPGLLPFAPLMGRPEGVSLEAWLRECVEAVDRAVLDDAARADTYAILRIFSELVCEDTNLLDHLIGRNLVQYSAFLEKYVQQGLEQGLEQGRERELIEAILTCLGTRFRPRAARALKPTLETIRDLDHLREIYQEALIAETFELFMETLGE